MSVDVRPYAGHPEQTLDRPALGERFWSSPRWPIAPPTAPVARRVLLVVAVAAVVVRFLPAGPLWFDEAQTVSISHLAVPQLLGALRQDGSPPLYYLLLHMWMLVFGTGTWEVRALSGVIGVATIPVFAALTRRLLPEPARWPAVLLMATSPFAIRYSAETRMYALVILAVAVGAILVCRVLEEPSLRRMAALPFASAALAYTHYWGLFLLAATGIGLVWHAVRRRSLASRRAAIGLALGALLYLPWLPSMLFQIANTGTPWAHAGLLSATMAVAVWGGVMHWGVALLFAVPLVVILGISVVAGASRRPEIRPVLWVTLATLALAGLASVLLGSAVVPRYTSVGLVPYLVVAGAGIATLPGRVRTTAVRSAVTLGLVAGALNVTAPRTLAGRIAGALHRQGGPGDSVVYCPDQLGPDVARLLPGWPQQMMFPTGAFPYRVDWVDYVSRNLSASPMSFAQTVVADSSDQPIWLVEATNYISFGTSCQTLASDLASMRPAFVATPLGSNPMSPNEKETLVEYLPNPRL